MENNQQPFVPTPNAQARLRIRGDRLNGSRVRVGVIHARLQLATVTLLENRGVWRVGEKITVSVAEIVEG